MWKEPLILDYKELRKLKTELIDKENKTADELQLLAELQSLSQIIDKVDYSLALSKKICRVCGRPL